MPPIVYITRRFHFSAAHQMQNPAWSAAENEAFYGPCSNLHGHNYELEVTLGGSPDLQTGYLLDLRQVKTLIESEILSKLDHKVLNTDVPFLQNLIPSTENLIIALWKQIEQVLPSNVKLIRLRLWETPNNYFEYYGEELD